MTNRFAKKKAADTLARIWDVIWVPIDNSPIEPVVSETPARPQPVFGQPLLVQGPKERIFPHQRHLKLSDRERWGLYSSFKLPPEEDEVIAPLRRAA